MQGLQLDTEAKRSIARQHLNRVIQSGMAGTGAVINKILTTVPHDELQPAQSSALNVQDGQAYYRTKSGNRPISGHAFDQLAKRVGMDPKYAKGLLLDSGEEDNKWRADLLTHAMGEHLDHTNANFLVRSVDGQVRGVLSDKFKRMDSRPSLDAFIGAAKAFEAVPCDGYVTETRCTVRCIVPRIIEPTEGEMCVMGLRWQNSDFGVGSYTMSAFLLRLVCFNGMVGENVLRRTHLGGRLTDENIEYSSRTYQLDQETIISATKDAVAGILAPAKVDERVEMIRKAASQEIDFERVMNTVGKTLTKTDRKAVEDTYKGPDQLNMPAGNTLWRFSNALSWVANSDEVSEERRIDLQDIAGKALNLK